MEITKKDLFKIGFDNDMSKTYSNGLSLLAEYVDGDWIVNDFLGQEILIKEVEVLLNLDNLLNKI